MSQTFTHAGVSKLNGKFKVRFCNDALRQKVLIKNGHTGIDIVELKHPMTKSEAVEFLLKIDFDNGNKAVRAALEAAADKRGVTTPVAKPAAVAKKAAPKAPVKKAAVAKVVAKPVKTEAEAIAAVKADLEDAPF